MQQVVDVPPVFVVVFDRLVQPLAPKIKATILVQPILKPAPLADKRLMGDFHGLLLRRGRHLAVCCGDTFARFDKQAQFLAGKFINDDFGLGGQRTRCHAPARVFLPLVRTRQTYQLSEHAAYHVALARFLETRVFALGSVGDRFADAADGLIGAAGEAIAGARGVQLSQGVLQQGQTAGLVSGVAQQQLRQARIEFQARQTRRLHHCTAQFIIG